MALNPAAQADYEALLLALRPVGPAWPEGDPNLSAAAEEFARPHNRAVGLADEADPRSTTELLADWERVAGLPTECAPLATTLQGRRAALVSQLIGRGGQSKAFYESMARELGYEISVSEFNPFKAGVSQAGEELTNENWLHHWMVQATETRIFAFRAGNSVAGDPLRIWGNAQLECAINTRKPAHTEVIFTYGT
ncbi:YmfQ family protein [Thauera phenylacetica]|uniref:YmfQ family protein n=1 Tax=Thauera phenylacetica TaxID=164400 RepID=UPI0039E6EEAC